MTTTSETPLAVAVAAQSLTAEAAALQARITELRGTLALLDLQMESVSDSLHRLRGVDTEHVPVSAHPSVGS
ncbi:hypothetical protein ACIRJS_45050 [Streptomyces sp. NPDC102340]|uniref:hypothetical protein n=1 Tax=unclassified Streptomyces TaxID=2593676 RepID=UPI00380635F2